MSTPLLVLIIVLVLVVGVGSFVFSQFIMIFGLTMYRVIVWRTSRTMTRVSGGRPRFAVSIMILAAVVQGIIAAWLVYLTTFVISNFEAALSAQHLFMVLAGMGAMFPAAVFLRAADVALNRAVPSKQAPTGPIALFLRSFATEGSFHNESRFVFGIRVESEEEEIAQLFASAGLGALVGLSRPGQVFQELGAVRVEIGSQGWQAAVTGLISRANVVAMQLGESEALLWELDAIVRSGKLGRTLFLLPVASDHTQLVERYNALLTKIAGKPNYPRLPAALQPDDRFLFFDDAGRGFIIAHSAKYTGKLADLLTPFFKQLGVSPPAPAPVYANVVGRITLFFVGAYLLVLLIVSQLTT